MNRAWGWYGVWSLLAALGFHTAVQAQATASLDVSVKGFKGSEGVALVTVFNTEETWLKVPKAVKTFKAPIEGGNVSVKVDGLTPGTYGVSVVHDANKNDELDMRWFPFPKPKEGAGASRDPKSKMGPPKWKDANFEVKAGEEKKLLIQMQYF